MIHQAPTTDINDSCENTLIKESEFTAQTENKIKPKRKSNIFSFKGRATRTEYWLVTFICNFVALPANSDADMTPLFTLLYFAVLLAMLWVYFATMVRRCHDRGKAWYFILIPLYYILLYFLPCQEEENEFGPNPRDKKADD